jgi:hypothetical protein
MSDVTVYTTNSKTHLTIPYRGIDNSTSLTLVGHDSENYGPHLINNVLHIIENFKDGYPENPVIGQTYYDSSNQELLYYTGTWEHISYYKTDKRPNIIYLNKQDNLPYLDQILEKLVPVSGDNKPFLMYGLTPTENDHAATIGYADSVLQSMKNTAPPLLPKAENATMTGQLRLKTPTQDDPLTAGVTLGYLKNLGKLQCITHVTDDTLIVTYTEDGRQYNGKPDNRGYFTTVHFQRTIAKGDSSVTIVLPFAFMNRTDSGFRMYVICNTLAVKIPITTRILNGSSISLSISPTTDTVTISGHIYGFRSTPLVGIPNV